jgi:hypothetical protein
VISPGSVVSLVATAVAFVVIPMNWLGGEAGMMTYTEVAPGVVAAVPPGDAGLYQRSTVSTEVVFDRINPYADPANTVIHWYWFVVNGVPVAVRDVVDVRGGGSREPGRDTDGLSPLQVEPGVRLGAEHERDPEDR